MFLQVRRVVILWGKWWEGTQEESFWSFNVLLLHLGTGYTDVLTSQHAYYTSIKSFFLEYDSITDFPCCWKLSRNISDVRHNMYHLYSIRWNNFPPTLSSLLTDSAGEGIGLVSTCIALGRVFLVLLSARIRPVHPGETRGQGPLCFLLPLHASLSPMPRWPEGSSEDAVPAAEDSSFLCSVLKQVLGPVLWRSIYYVPTIPSVHPTHALSRAHFSEELGSTTRKSTPG